MNAQRELGIIQISKQVHLLIELDLIDGDIEAYTERMTNSVLEGLALSVTKNGVPTAWFYGRMDGYLYYGDSIYASDMYSGILLMRSIFGLSVANSVRFTPHSVANMKWFKSMITGDSIRAWHSGSADVVILKDEMLSKGRKVFDYLGFV